MSKESCISLPFSLYLPSPYLPPASAFIVHHPPQMAVLFVFCVARVASYPTHLSPFSSVLSEGFPVPNSTCDRILPGRTGPFNGAISGPEDWHRQLIAGQEEERPTECSTTLAPTDSQSVTVVVSVVRGPTKNWTGDLGDEKYGRGILI